MKLKTIERNVKRIISSIPSDVLVIAAAKTRSLEEVLEAMEAGIKYLGYNYIQEAEAMYNLIGDQIKWHMIGHLQRNKAKIAVQIFDTIETIDSILVAKEIDKRSKIENRIMPVLIEINSGKESNKTGVEFDELEMMIDKIKDLSNLKVEGLMTMGPRFGNPEDARPYFQATKTAFDKMDNNNIPNIEMKYLSMGMSNSYTIAIEEGANIIRIGNRIFNE